MSPCLEFEGKSVDKAVETACAELKITKDQLKYDIISYGSSGIFGLVAVKKAKIKVTLKQTPTAAKKEKSPDLKEISTTAKKDKKPESKEKRTAAKKERKPEPKQTPTSEKTEPKPEPEQTPTSEKIETKTEPKQTPIPENIELIQDPGNFCVDDVAQESELIGNGEITTFSEETLALGKTALQTILDFITTDTEVSVGQDHERILFDVRGGNSAILIGKRGQTLEAIQYLLEKILNKSSEKRIRVQVDIEGYLDNRQDRLRGLSARLAEKAKLSGKPVTVGQLNAHDRRIIHLSLRNDNTVRTQSMGDGPFRKLVIFPKKGQKRRRPQKNTETAD